jgi:phage terminase large subunit
VLRKTTAQIKIAKLRKRIRVVQGGSSSSKTFTIIPLLIYYAYNNPNKEISIVSESIPHLRRGAMRDFVKIMGWIGILDYSNWNKSTLTYYFDNGSFIEFFSADQPDKMRGARRDVLFVNEANNVEWESYHQLSIRTREFIYIDYNPTAEFWAHKELVGKNNVDFIILTYKDNEALEESIIREFKLAEEKAKTSKYWANWCRVYIDGEIGNLQGAVFENWETAPIPDQSRLLYYGCDFGFATSKFAVVAVYNYNNTFYIKELVYQTNLTNQDAAALMVKNGYKKGMVVYCDYAEPKSIEELRRAGINAVPCDSKQDIKQFAIQKLNSQKFYIDEKSINLVEELRYYIWDEKTGKPKKSDRDHCMDALTYAIGSAGKYSGNYR